MGEVFEAGMQVAWAQCWQVTLLILAVWLTIRATARNRPHLASVLWLVVLIKCVTPPLWSSPSSVFSWLQAQALSDDSSNALDLHSTLNDTDRLSNRPNDIVVQMPRDEAARLVPPEVSLDTDIRQRSAWEQTMKGMTSWSGILALTWLFGCLGFACIACVRGLLCWSRLHRAGAADAPEVVQLAARLSHQLGLKWPVRVVVSRSPVGPAVVGIIRPTVILPSLIVDAKTLAELEPLLAHEMIHIRRGDLWIGLLQLLAQGLWWFHPLVRMVNQLATREAERCCDEEVIARLGCEPGQYARSLIDVLALKRTLQPIPAFPGVRPVDVTSQRLERIMKLGQGCHKRTPRWCWLVMLLAVAATLPGAALSVVGDEPAAEVPRDTPLATQPQPVSVVAAQVEQEELLAGPGSNTRVYSVQDIVERIQKDLQIDDPNARVMLIEMVRQAALPPVDAAKVVLPPKENPTTWAELAAARLIIKWSDQALIIKSSKDSHERIANRLRSIREDGLEQLQIETRLITGSLAAAETISADWKTLDAGATDSEFKSLPDDQSEPGREDSGTATAAIRGRVESVVEKHHPALLALVEPEQVKTIISEAQAHTRTNLIQAPKVTLFNGQSATVEDCIQRPFVVAMKRTAEGTAPVVRIVREGFSLNVRPKLSGQQNVRLDLTLNLSEIRNVETATLLGGKNQKSMTVQVPEVASTKIRSVVDMKLGQTMLINVLATRRPNSKEQQPFLLLVNVKKFVPEGNSQAATAKPEPTPPSGILPVAAAEVTDPNVGKYLTALAQDFAKHEQQLETRVYAVADLVIPMPGFSPKTLEQVQAVAEGLERTQVKVDYKALLELITTTIEPNSWDTNGGRGSIRPFDKIMSLVIRQTRVNHEQIQKLLERMRTFQDLQVSFHIERVTLTKAEFEQWLAKAKGPGVEKLKGGTGGAATPLSDVAVTLIRNFSSAGVQSGPKMTLFNGQQAEIPLDLVDPKTAGCIPSLHLLPILTPTLDRLQINVSVGQSADRPAQHMELVSVPAGQSLLIDLLEQSWLKKTVGVPVLDKIPHIDRLFKNAAADMPEGDRQFYLLTPRVMLIQEVEVQKQ